MLASVERVEETRARLRRARRRRMAGGSHGDLAVRVREALRRGILFPVDGTSWIGRGSGATCDVCDEPIRGDEAEHEVILPRRVRAHSACYLVWYEESKSFGEQRPLPG
jgi:hypothetical protein